MADEKKDPNNLNRSPYVVMPELSGGSSSGNWGGRITSGLTGSRRGIMILVAVGIVILAVAGLAGYFLFGGKGDETAQNAPEIVIDSPDEGRQDEEPSDSDEDGLIDSEEAVRGTDQNNPDSDSDGLADGDEISVYGSDPRQPDSDSDGFNDGAEVARGYSPIANAASKAEATERQSWLARSLKPGLHEPTVTTLASYQETGSSDDSDSRTLYTNTFYKYRIEYDNVLSVREERSGQIVGLTIVGAEPAEDVSLEPFVISLAGSKALFSLMEWAETQFSPAEYDIEEMPLNGTTAVRVSEKGDGDCRQIKTFISNNNVIIAIAWNCGSPAQLAPYYEKIVSSFIFVP